MGNRLFAVPFASAAVAVALGKAGGVRTTGLSWSDVEEDVLPVTVGLLADGQYGRIRPLTAMQRAMEAAGLPVTPLVDAKPAIALPIAIVSENAASGTRRLRVFAVSAERIYRGPKASEQLLRELRSGLLGPEDKKAVMAFFGAQKSTSRARSARPARGPRVVPGPAALAPTGEACPPGPVAA